MRTAFSQRRRVLSMTRTGEGLDCRQNPDTPAIGRQPHAIQIAPSKDYPWYGTVRGSHVVTGTTGPIAIAGGDRFTDQQLATLKRLKIDPAKVETLHVKRQAVPMEVWVPRGHLPPVYAFDCPVIGRSNGKVKVVAPAGTLKLVFPDGWGHHPIRIARGDDGEPLPPPLPPRPPLPA